MKKQIKRFRARTLASVIAMAFVANAWAVDFTVRDIRVEGLQRVEPGTVFASLPFRVGDQYNDDKGSAAIRALFGLGLFKDVRLEVSGDVLVVIVEERPTVADVDFTGSKEFDKDTLKKALRDIGLTEGRPYDQALADRAEQELKRQYINRSLYGAEVVTTVTPIERNRVNLSFAVTEGEPARIKDIRVVGNKAFSESTLKGLFDLDTGGFLSWYTKSDRYARNKLNADLESLRSYYLQRGYLEFRIDSTQVAISPDKQDITITVNVTEGERYLVTGVKLEGNYLNKDDEFKSLVRIKPGEPYNADHVARPPRPSPITSAISATPSRRSRPARRSTASTTASPSSWWPSLRAAPMCAASTSPATTAPGTKWCAASSASSNRAGTTATRSSSRATGWTGWATSRMSTSRPPTWPARPTRWT